VCFGQAVEIVSIALLAKLEEAKGYRTRRELSMVRVSYYFPLSSREEA